MPGPTVFLSYSHQDEAWKDRVVRHLGTVASLDVWDDRRTEAGGDWRAEIEVAMGSATAAVLLVSADFLNSRFIRDVEVPRLLERRREQGVRIVPLILSPCAWQRVLWLARLQTRPKDGRPLSAGSVFQIETDLAALAEELYDLLRLSPVAASAPTVLLPEHVSLHRLPTTSEVFVGREKEIRRLDAAWADSKVHVISLVAFGGVGKSALVNRWLGRMETEAFRGAERVFGWSFYSQGSGDKAESADVFFAEALRWFGDPDPAAGTADERAARLVALLRRSRTLLVLDGLEPLQYPPGPMEGRLKDRGLAVLVKELASANPGLCVITTRVRVFELASRESTTAPRIDLEHLSAEAGAELLKRLQVKGLGGELRQAATEFGGNALALTLLGNYLHAVHGGEVRQRDRVRVLEQDSEQGGHAMRVMAAYEEWLGPGPEVAVLRMLGLFNRPTDPDVLAALRAAPPIPGLTEALFPEGETLWRRALARLREAGLLAEPSPGDSGALDTHPLVRAYFGDRLRTGAPEAWRAGNLRVYEHLLASAPDLPDTLEEMAPLFAAIFHGCRAGRYQEALDEVYLRRIQRGNEAYSTRKLGALGVELAALSDFFDRPWDRPAAALSARSQAFILNEAGFHLRAMGRLAEAVAPMRAGLEVAVKQEQWSGAAISADNLAALTLTLGRLEEAVAHARLSVELADQSGNTFQRMGNRTTLADALHQAARAAESEALFREAEAMQERLQPSHPRLYSLQGYLYCDFRLGPAEALLNGAGKAPALEEADRLRQACGEVLERATELIKMAEESHWLLDIALDHLTLGRAHLTLHRLATLADGEAGLDAATLDLAQSSSHLDEAMDGLRRAGQDTYLPLGLLARATLRRVQGETARAEADLAEALEIAERGGMRLHEADAHLEWARLGLSAGRLAEARGHLARAKALVEATGYHRRDPEVAALANSLIEDFASEPFDPFVLAFRLVVDRRLPVEFLNHLDPEALREAVAGLEPPASEQEHFHRAQITLQQRQPELQPNPLWLAWIRIVRSNAFDHLFE